MKDILNYDSEFKAKVASLRNRSGYYPSIIQDVDEIQLGGDPKNVKMYIFYSTLVRIKRGDIWYVVHHVESCFLDRGNSLQHKQIIEATLNRFTHAIEMTRLFRNHLPEIDQVDSLQITEEERLNPMNR